MNEEAAFITAIVAEPDDDTRRLAFADWLDEQEPKRVPCPHNGACPVDCDGISYLDTSAKARAELIRIQIELDRMGDPPPEDKETGGRDERICEKCGTRQLCELRHRCIACQSEFLRKVRSFDDAFPRYAPLVAVVSRLVKDNPEWRPSCPECNGTGVIAYHSEGGCPLCGISAMPGSGRVGTFVRGFLDSIEVPTLSRVILIGVSTAVMVGDTTVTAPFTPTSYGTNLVSRFPTLTRIRVRDLIENIFADESPTPGQSSFGWWDESNVDIGGTEGDVPAVIFDRMWRDAGKFSRRKNESNARWLVWRTREEAVDALAVSTCDVIREFVNAVYANKEKV